MNRLLVPVLTIALLVSGPVLQAAPPQNYVVRYDASYGKFKAQSARSLEYLSEQHIYVMRAETRLTLLGGTLSSIEEYSAVSWQNDQPVPLEYRFVQKGLGSRERSVRFDHAREVLEWTVDEKQGELPITEPVYDDLSSFLVLREQLLGGATSLQFKVSDKAEIKPYQYDVVAMETLDTALGSFDTVHLSRIREPGSTRTTEIWLAPDLDYLLLKLLQSEPDGRDIKLEVREIEGLAP